jgi:nucleoside-diphosphate-sugar epimerase
MSEDLLPNPSNVYGASKLCQETIARTYNKQYGLKTTVLRSATMYGAYSREKQAIPIFLGQVMQSLPVTLEGDGKQSRDFIHVADVAEACELACEYEGNGIDGETINIGSGNETPFLSLINAIKYILQQPTDEFDSMGVRKDGYIPIKFLPFRGGEEGLRVVLDNSKAKEKLDWVPSIKFNDGLRHTCAWYASDILKFEKDEMEELMELMFPNKYTSGLSVEINNRIYQQKLHNTPGAVVFSEEEFQDFKRKKIERLNNIFKKHNQLEHPQES